MYQSMMRPKDSEPDDRDLRPDEYIHYIQEHGKECDRIEPELNKQFIQNTLRRAAQSGTPFQSSSKYILDNNPQKNNNILSDNNNPMRRNLSYAPSGPSSFMPTKQLKRTPPGESNRYSQRNNNGNVLSDINNPMRRNLSYAPGGAGFMPNKELKRTPPKESNRYEQVDNRNNNNNINNNNNFNNNTINNNNNFNNNNFNRSYNDNNQFGNSRNFNNNQFSNSRNNDFGNSINSERQYSQVYKITQKLDDQPLNNQIRQSPLLRHQNSGPDPNQHNYIKTEPVRSAILQKQIKSFSPPPQNNEYQDLYVDEQTRTPLIQNEKEKRFLNRSMDYNKETTQNPLSENFDMRPYYTEQGMKIYPGNYQGMTFKRPINENLYDVRYPPNVDNRKEIRKDYHTTSAVSHTIPDYILFDNLNYKNTNTLRPYYFYDDNNIQYRQYSPYRADYDGSRFGDPTYNYYLNGPMRGDVSKDWRYPPQYYYQPNEDFIKVPRVKL